MEELSLAIEGVDVIRGQIEAMVNRDVASTLELASTCLAGRVEVRFKNTFAGVFAFVMRYLLNA